MQDVRWHNAEMRRYDATQPGSPLLVFAHGAGAGHDHPWMKRVAQGLADRGVSVVTFDFPYMAAKKRGAPDRPPVLEEAFVSVWRQAAAGADGRLFGGGKSMGGRIASQVAARGALEPAPAGLVFFGYPLHPPGNAAQRRDKHLPDVTAPMLFLSGTRDPFGSPEELRDLAGGLPNATLELFDGGDHSIAARSDKKGELLQRAIDIAARWIVRGSG